MNMMPPVGPWAGNQLQHLDEERAVVEHVADEGRAGRRVLDLVPGRRTRVLEDTLADARMCGAKVRSAAEWAVHAQGAGGSQSTRRHRARYKRQRTHEQEH